MGLDHPLRLRVEEVLDTERPLLARQGRGRLQPQLEVPVPGAVGRERFDLDQQRGHQVERHADRGEFAQQRYHAPVIFKGVQADPRKDVLAGHQILVERLMHMPEERDAGHNAVFRALGPGPGKGRDVHEECESSTAT